MASQRKIIMGVMALFVAASLFFSAATADPIPYPLTIVDPSSLPTGTGISLLPCNSISNSICCGYTSGSANYVKCSLALLCTPSC